MAAKEAINNNFAGRLVRYAPLLFWIALIFFFSSGQGSMSRTSILIRPLLEFLFPGTPEDILVVYHGYIRKSAHFFAYAGLAFWSWRAFKDSSAALLRRYWFPASLILVATVATLDEINQSFNDARTGSIRDVGLDISGGLAMLSLILLMINIFSLRRSTGKNA
jgi:VanZ family protein